MKRMLQGKTRVAAWLLCVLLSWLSVSAPHCDLCDGPHVVAVGAVRWAVQHPGPVERDDCNGVCACCGFHWMPDGDPVMNLVQTVGAAAVAEGPEPLLTPRTSLFRPPRLVVSS